MRPVRLLLVLLTAACGPSLPSHPTLPNYALPARILESPRCSDGLPCAQVCPDGGACEVRCWRFQPVAADIQRCVERATACEQLECPAGWSCHSTDWTTLECVLFVK